jgi:phosphoserine aminotransferase
MVTDHKGAAAGERGGERLFNFSPGPAVLPLEVLEEIRRDMLCLPGVGSSILEISHRSPAFDEILAETRRGLGGLLGVPDTHEIVFLQGGANLQFSMIPMNLLRGQSEPADFIVTGTWGAGAANQAALEGSVAVSWDGKSCNYNRLPEPGEIAASPQAAYVHLTSNETIQGVQWKQMPQTGDAPLVCDASSDFLSRPVDVSKLGLLYACAQKNAGIAGVTVVVIRKELLQRSAASLPAMLSYKVHAEKDSRANTPPVFAIYVLNLVCRWIRDTHGDLDKLAAHNAAKAALLYDVLDTSEGFYTGHAATACRSDMNVTFRLPSEELEKAFVAEAAEEGLVDLQGHRSVGGIRASVYNAMPLAGVEKLRDFMTAFRQSHRSATGPSGTAGGNA